MSLTLVIDGQKFQFKCDDDDSKWSATTEYNWIEYRNDNVSFVPLKISKPENISALFRRPAEFSIVGDKIMITWRDDLIGNIVIHLEKVPTSIDEDVQIQFKRQSAEIAKLRDELKQVTEEIERLINPEVHSLMIHRTDDGIRVQISTAELRVALLKYFGQVVPELIRKTAAPAYKSLHPWVGIALEKKYKKYNSLECVEDLIALWADGKNEILNIFSQYKYEGGKYIFYIITRVEEYSKHNKSSFSNILSDFQLTYQYSNSKFCMYRFDLQKQYLYEVDKLADYKLPKAYKCDDYRYYNGLSTTPTITRIAFVDATGKHIKLEPL